MTTDIRIRPATDADLAAVADIYTHYVVNSVATFDLEPLSLDAWHERAAAFRKAGLPFLVAEATESTEATEATNAAGTIAGYSYAGPWKPKHAYRHSVENTVYITPGWTGKGLGRALMTTLIDECRTAGLQQMIAVIALSEDNSSPALHRTLGFRDAGTLTKVGYKHNKWIDTLLMQLDLTSS
jgi:phosphinothricin acetyltransferase